MKTARFALIPILMAFVLLASTAAQAVVVQGFGIDRHQALNNALQTAVESEIGVYMDSQTQVENFMVIKDEILTHAKGYVSSYKILKEGPEGDGYALSMDAVVNKGVIGDHINTLEILMKMASHPRVVIFGVDDDFDSIPSGTMIFDPLVTTVSDVFRENFRFEVIDWAAAKAKYPGIPGKLTREQVLRHNNELRAQLYVAVKLNLKKQSGNLDLIMDSARISDNTLLGETNRQVPFEAGGSEGAGLYRKAVAAAQEDAFLASVDLAKQIVAGIQDEVERGHGFRYSLSFYDFPDEEKLIKGLQVLHGYVRHDMERGGGPNLVLSYWSNLRGDALFDEVKGLLEKDGYKYKAKMDGRDLKFKWEHPEGF